MAKDGTQRGGPRLGAGVKAKADPALGMPDFTADLVLPEPDSPEGEVIPKVEEYMKEPQKDGSVLMAEKVFINTWIWLRGLGCEKYVGKELVEVFAMSYARMVQCERAISSYGFLSKHPTTGNPIASPFTTLSIEFKKQMTQTWYQIYAVVKDSAGLGGIALENDPMEKMLSGK